MQYLKIVILPILFLLGYVAYFNINLYQSTLLISKSAQSLKDFEFDSAMDQSKTSITLSPNNADAHSNRGYIYGILWIFRKEDQYKKEMDASFEKATSLTINNAVYYYKWAAIYADSGKYEDALQKIEQAIKTDPNAGAYYNEKAVYLEALGRKKEALQMYQQAYDLSKAAIILPNINRLKEELHE
ncbi:tetratricopeptide repeat protein [Deinococcus roseus]|uniref:Tetratricopeptide repeat protein n=1 Tax=Deinococcus roseus TaxID=392414 RepID=A0ABQ2CVH3_9DEIO|nr:tetratricopeptide repeat protein [Deinococcus roseus]GGJ24858.1 hypothetical protein GCM10008938_08730 [Deinococcus roseus]